MYDQRPIARGLRGLIAYLRRKLITRVGLYRLMHTQEQYRATYRLWIYRYREEQVVCPDGRMKAILKRSQYLTAYLDRKGNGDSATA